MTPQLSSEQKDYGITPFNSIVAQLCVSHRGDYEGFKGALGTLSRSVSEPSLMTKMLKDGRTYSETVVSLFGATPKEELREYWLSGISALETVLLGRASDEHNPVYEPLRELSNPLVYLEIYNKDKYDRLLSRVKELHSTLKGKFETEETLTLEEAGIAHGVFDDIYSWVFTAEAHEIYKSDQTVEELAHGIGIQIEGTEEFYERTIGAFEKKARKTMQNHVEKETLPAGVKDSLTE